MKTHKTRNVKTHDDLKRFIIHLKAKHFENTDLHTCLHANELDLVL